MEKVVCIACVKSKRSQRSRVEDLYTSSLFMGGHAGAQMARRPAASSNQYWMIGGSSTPPAISAATKESALAAVFDAARSEGWEPRIEADSWRIVMEHLRDSDCDCWDDVG